MQKKYVKHNSQPEAISPLTEEEFAEACRASARKYSTRRMQLGLMFRAAQEEAYATWDAWDKALGGESEMLGDHR